MEEPPTRPVPGQIWAVSEPLLIPFVTDLCARLGTSYFSPPGRTAFVYLTAESTGSLLPQ